MKILNYNRLALTLTLVFQMFFGSAVLLAQEDNYLYPKVKRLEGQGNGGVWLNLTQATVDNIVSNVRVQQPEYESGTSPIVVRVSNPADLKEYDYVLKLSPQHDQGDASLVDNNAHWTLTWYQNGNQLGSYTSQHSIGEGVEEEIAGHGIVITVKNHPFSFYGTQMNHYIEANGGGTYRNNAWYAQPDLIGSVLACGTGTPWLDGLHDAETSTPDNWIRAGRYKATSKWECNSVQPNMAGCDYRKWRTEDFFNIFDYGYYSDYTEQERGFMDYYGQFEHIAGGTWAPYVLSSPYDGGPKAKYLVRDVVFEQSGPTPSYFDFSFNSLQNTVSYNQTMTNLYSVDIVLTSDKSKWTRALVLEAGSSALNGDGTVSQHFNGQTYQNIRHEPKNCPSVDKNGNPDNSGTTGYGWFPGYAINVETGERLNIMFAENSEDEYNHGNDMIFNPTNVYAFQRDNEGHIILDGNGQPIPMTVEEYNTLYSSYVCDHAALGEPLNGGRHYVYICSSSGNTANTFYRSANRQRNYNDDNQIVNAMGTSHGGTFTGTDGVSYPYYECGVYDEGKWLGEKFKTITETNLNATSRKARKMQVFNNVMYTGIPMPAAGQESNWLSSDALVRIRVSRPYMFYSSAVGVGPDNVTNDNAPAFSFSMQDIGVAQGYNLYVLSDDMDNNDNRIDINNIDAPVKPKGGAWFFNDIADYHVPKGTDKTSYFCYSFWMGGLDGQDSLHIFAERFNQVGDDTWPGPLSTVDASIDEQTKVKWDRTFKITRSEVLEFMASYQNPDYVIPKHILEWPAHGDTTKGQAWLLAPFADVDGDGVYNPYHGDYPDFPGDMAQFVIFNDSYGEHTESQGAPMGAEVHVMVYAYDAPEDSLMNNTIFFKYKIFNRSQQNYHNTYIGLWSDWDLGYANDDYVGCDVMKNTAYCYNGSDVDGSGQPWAYGDQWPIQTLTLLAGPYLPADGRDNPAYTEETPCDAYLFGDYAYDRYAFNGIGFGDSIVDNERYGMTGFVYHNNDNSVTGDPQVAFEYYNLMQGIWKDNSRMRYGANGHPSNGASGPECRYMFPSLSDPCNWGTGGIDPNPLQFGSDGWTEANVGNAPYDRRALASVGPFDFSADEMQELDFCLVTIPHNYAVNRLGFTLDSLKLVNPEYHSQNFITPVVVDLNQSICEGESFDFFGESLENTGIYRHYIRNSVHSNDIADTIVRLHLNVVPAYTLIYASVLPGQSYNANGFSIPASATGMPGTHVYTQPVSSVSGCNNMLVLFLDVRVDAGVEDHQLVNNIKIYPNPTTQYVFVEMDEAILRENQEPLTVFDINGKLLYSQPIEDTRIQIDMSGYPSGFYVIKIGHYVGKVVKR